jgi:pSer/pThr/pTyr-binding forkhead associated (FHA) protein
MPLTVVLLGTDPRRTSAIEGTGEPLPRPRLTFDSPRIVVGRGDGCDVRLPDRSVSHRHLTLRQRGGDWLLVDEGSTNGTIVQRVALAAQSPRVAQDGDRVRIGRQWLELRISSADVPTAPAAAKEAAIALVLEALGDEGIDGRPLVEVTSGPDAGKSLRIPVDRRVILGRARDADLVLEDEGASRRHVEIGRRSDQIVVRDLGSKTGATLAGEPLADKDVAWKPGEVLELAGCAFGLDFEALGELADVERAPDEKIAPGSIPWPDAEAVAEAPPDPSPDEVEGASDDEHRVDEAAAPSGNRRVPAAPPSRGGWSATDLAVVLLALGLLALCAVGYLVLLRR